MTAPFSVRKLKGLLDVHKAFLKSTQRQCIVRQLLYTSTTDETG